MSFRFVKRDVGKGHRGIDRGDCTVRALVIAAGISYPDAWQMLYEAQGRHRATAFLITEFMKVEPVSFGVIRYLSFPAMRGKPRMTAKQFSNLHPKGSYILSLASHVAAMEDATLYDTWNCSDRCVYGAFQIDPAAFNKEPRQ